MIKLLGFTFSIHLGRDGAEEEYDEPEQPPIHNDAPLIVESTPAGFYNPPRHIEEGW